jgi:hypothetical protein
LLGDVFEVFGAEQAQVGAFGEVLAQEPVEVLAQEPVDVLVGAALPGRGR